MDGTPRGWAKSLEAVLADRSALDCFREWLDEHSSPQYLELYFAIRAYERMSAEGNPEKIQLAKSIYSKYLSSRTGNCEAIPSKYRSPIGEKLHKNLELDEGIFWNCSSFVMDFLRRQHEEFVGSDEFIDALNKMTSSLADSAHFSHQNTNTQRRSHQLTAEALLKSKHERHSKLGETKLEKMYPPTRQPYVCNATTSHNDSAVSSSFSGDAAATHRSHGHRQRHVREKQARENAGTFTVPRIDKIDKIGEQKFDHSSESGRRYFAMEITRKLLRFLDKMKVADEMERHINDIQECRYTTIDMVNGTEPDDNLGKIDEDEELDDYLKMKMTDESQKGSAARSPKATQEKNGKQSKNSTLLCSPPSAPLHNTLLRHPHHPKSARKELKEFVVDSPNFMMTSSTSKPRHHQIDTCYSTASSSTFSNSFAPSPLKCPSSSSQMYDSSGIGSMAPSSYSEESGRRRHHLGQMKKPRGTRNLSNLITISYLGADKVPVVAHVPNEGPMTLAEFRRHFALTAASQQLFFKTDCEDGSAPFQLLLIKDEHHLLPVFEGRITAELR